MPRIILQTNVPATEVSASFCDGLVECLAESMGVPSANVGLAVHAGIYLRFANNSTERRVHLDISKINMDTSKTYLYGRAVTEYVAKNLNIPNQNIMIWFARTEAHMVANGGATVSDIWRDQTK